MSRLPQSMPKFMYLLYAVGLAALPAITPLTESAPEATTTPSVAQQRDGRHDFDFLSGRWYAHSRRLVKPLQGSDQWEEFESVHDGVLLPSGFGVADDFRIVSRPDFVGLALQVYNPAKRQWQAYWYRLGVLSEPLLGVFKEGVGVFEGPDELDGKSIITRYTWSDITANSARWEQAYSADGGKTWERNWIMNYRRTRPVANNR